MVNGIIYMYSLPWMKNGSGKQVGLILLLNSRSGLRYRTKMKWTRRGTTSRDKFRENSISSSTIKVQTFPKPFTEFWKLNDSPRIYFLIIWDNITSGLSRKVRSKQQLFSHSNLQVNAHKVSQECYKGSSLLRACFLHCKTTSGLENLSMFRSLR